MKLTRAFLLTSLIVGFLISFSLAGAPRPDAFQCKERVVFFGDSITHAGNYLLYLQVFEALRHPHRRAVFMNAGSGGNDLAAGIRRIEFDVRNRKPDRVFIMFGMNDVGRENYKVKTPDAGVEKSRRRALDVYRKRLCEMIGIFEKYGIEVVLMTPTPYDQYRKGGKNLPACNEPGLAACAQIVREIAEEKKLPLIDLHAPLTALLKKYPDAALCGLDRIHPGVRGHQLIMALILKATGENPVVADMKISLPEGKNECVNCRISDWKTTGNRLSFEYVPQALPYPVGKEYLKNDRIYPMTRELNMELLEIKGLEPGEYELVAGGNRIGVFSSEDFAGGVNLALLETPSQYRARALETLLQRLLAADQRLRSIAYGNAVILREGKEIKPMEKAFAAIDEWLEKHRTSPHIRYYSAMVKAYKENRKREDELLLGRTVILEKMFQMARPTPYRIEIRNTGK